MKKLNEKGLTLVELIVSFALVSVAMLYFYQTVSTVSKLYKRAKIQTNQFTESTYTLRLVKDYCSIEENLNNCIEINTQDGLNNSFLKKIGSNLKVSNIDKDTQTIGSEMYSVLTFEYKDSDSPTFGLKDGKYLGKELTYKLYIKSQIAVLTTGTELKKKLGAYASLVTKIMFDKEKSEPTDGDWVLKKDISTNGNGTVWGILRDDPNNSGKYIFHITFNRKKVYANPNSKELFRLGTNNETYQSIPGFGYFMTNSLSSIENLSLLDTSKVIYMDYMFAETKLENIDLSGFDTSNVKSMVAMFNGSNKLLNLDLSNFDTSNVTDMNYMFANLLKIEQIRFGNKFNTSNVKDMHYLFYRTLIKKLDISDFDTSNVTDMHEMFADCRYLEELKFDTAKFNTSNVTLMSNMFRGCSKLTSLDVSKFDTSKVTNMESMFIDCSSLTSLDVSKFNTDKVNTSMAGMFGSCSKLTSLDVSNFNTSNVKNMGGMFMGLKLETLDLKKFNTSNVTNMFRMFYKSDGLKSITFSNEFNTSKVENMRDMFFECSSLTSLDITNFDTSNVKNMSSMFAGCKYLEELKFDTAKFNTSNVQKMISMFMNCSSLTSLNVSKFDTSNVDDMSAMFSGCFKLTELNLSNFTVEKVKNFENMFYNCSNLVTLNINNFKISSSVDNVRYMFKNDSKLSTLVINKSDFIIQKDKKVTKSGNTTSYYDQITQGCKKEIQDIINNQIK